MGELTVRKTPCGSCPYRRDVPSGIWHQEEYDKLRQFDGSTAEQALAGAVRVFMCHQVGGELCAGWVGCHDMGETLAIRVQARDIDPSVFEYRSPVPLFASGAEAAEHGLRDIARPGPAALAAQAKIARLRKLRGRPLR